MQGMPEYAIHRRKIMIRKIWRRSRKKPDHYHNRHRHMDYMLNILAVD